MLSSIARSLSILPAVDCVYDKAKYVFAIELPGAKKDDILLHAENNQISVEAKKDNPFKDLKVSQSDRLYGNYEVVCSVPSDADMEAINAAFADGVLTLTVPKSTKKQVKINIA
ncbi:Hsp20/alpha crystallin family protein [Trichomonas vaginalis G3]|uniref:Hsp20/alpha crystallin family protein n=1 Tax=Trichomonas vaginalis (strain ATCC PRA-98 / G3) TaxID=412133 RepID=A2FKC5_TRIV3|nr:response to heat [Trichomonas vaginalis G3]EAX94625.1 Hsp20/alpha crystallin family protein [Trichomonas vaginalis G3]KAI5494771.1 response to heat [Trichomonas vaginalis G3]|eukprot:XP_001307555.1 Hsp20/alpha crystallin family protein [Trichomonas vaginalis G3]